MLSLRNLSRSYAIPGSRRAVLAGIDLELARGEYVAILGESGIGKSTLLNLIAGLDRPDAGSVMVDGIDLATLDDDALARFRREKLGFVFQAFHLLPYLSAAQNVALPLALNGAPPVEAGDAAVAMLEAVGLAGRAQSRPHELSGGEMQRVAIARALVHRPSVVLADEPTGNLDAENAANVLALLRSRIKSAGATAVLATHSRMAAATADRCLMLSASGLAPVASEAKR